LITLIGDDVKGVSPDQMTVLVGGLFRVEETPPADTPDWRIMPNDA
jgi:hypothetical protein